MKQVIIYSDSNDAGSSFLLEDLSTGTHVTTIKGNNSTIRPRTLCMTEDYIVAAEENSHLIRFWSLSQGLKKDHRVILPDKVTSMTASSCGTLVFVEIKGKIYVWKTDSGKLVVILEDEKGFQAANVLKVSPDDSLFVSGSQDGVVSFWKISTIVGTPQSAVSSIRTWKSFPEAHSLAVTDISFGYAHFMASVGLDSKLVVSILTV